MNKDIEYDKKCGIAIDFIPNERFKNEIQECNSLDELSKECKKFVELCYKNKDKFYKDLDNMKYPSELQEFIEKQV